MRTRHFVPAALVLLLLTAVVTGCGSNAAESNDGAALDVVATTTQVADLVQSVGGDRVNVHRILDPNSDPHAYEPRPSDAAELADADIVFSSGGEVDEWLDGLIESAGGDASTVALIDAVETLEGGHEHRHGEEEHAGEEHADEERDVDPHWWQDPRNAVRAVAAIERALTTADPDGRSAYRTGARDYSAELRRLDAQVARCIDLIPPARRKLVTTHDALTYYAHRYDLEVVGALIPSLSTAAQASAGDVEALVEQIREQRVPAIFPESSLAPRLEQAVSRETGAEVGERLWADSLGPEGSSGETYIGSIEANTTAIVDGLTVGDPRCEMGS